MAEVLGLVASGISVAQVAGSILTDSLKLKSLLDEVKNAPECLRDMLDQLELLTPILCEATTSDYDAASTSLPHPSAHSHVQQALQNTLRACQTAGEQLELLAADLMSQIDVARGGVRLKRAMVKVVLKKGTLTQYGTRLQKMIQLLTLAQNTYIIAVQRTQPETIVSQLISALAQPPQDDLTRTERSKDGTSSALVTTTRKNRRPKGRNSSALAKGVQFGFAQVTGVVRIRTQPRDKGVRTTASTPGQFLRVQLQTPAWLCASVLDAALSRSYAGWTCSLNVYGKVKYDSAEYSLVVGAMENDDVDSIHCLFQERRCSPLDRFALPDGRLGNTLIQYAMRIGAWQVSSYLLDYGAEYDEDFIYGFLAITSVEDKPSFETFLMHNELSDDVRLALLASCCGSLGYFTEVISRVWPANDFYDGALEDERFNLALEALENIQFTLPSPSSAICQHLCASLSLTEAGTSTTTKILASVAGALGQLVWCDPDFASEWLSVLLDIALRVNKAFMMPAQQSFESESYYLRWFPLFSGTKPFTNLFLVSMAANPHREQFLKPARPGHKIKDRLANCERAAHMWLTILQECGIDLVEYGKQEKQWLDNKESGCDFRIFRDVWWDDRHETPNGQFEVRLISFKYGSSPGDWKLWWSEPTDELVGDFWREMELEERSLYIPGSWVED